MKDCYLLHLLQTFIENKSVIIFVQSCRNCQVIANLLRRLDVRCTALHSLLPQKDRIASLSRFKTGVVRILVATDVASRGLDIPLVELVINYNVPASPKDYIHRVGRTARAGRGGLALTLMTQYDIERVTAIEEHSKVKMTEFETSEADALKLLKVVSICKREVQIRLTDSNFGEKRLINKKKHAMLASKTSQGTKKKFYEKKRTT